MATALTPTSYAILGLLALKPWSTYELAQQMGRALGQFWPRAESRLDEEPKQLVAHGLARASSEMVGQRQRTVYTISPKGRRALAQWVPTPGEGPVLEFEQLIKVFFAEHATKADLLATLAEVRASSEQQLAASARVPQAYLAGKGPFPERLPWLLLVGQFLLEAGSCVGIVPPGGSCTVGVRFSPKAGGTASATLTAQSNAETNPVVSLAGTSTEASSATSSTPPTTASEVSTGIRTHLSAIIFPPIKTSTTASPSSKNRSRSMIPANRK